MDVKRIDQLPEATEPKGTDLLPLWQGEGTKKVPLAAIQASGPPGEDGFSPTVTVSKLGTQTTITITDAKGPHSATINDGAAGAPGKDGAAGAPGEDGFSPTVNINKVGKTTTITITDKTGPHVATIEDGADGEGGGGGSYTLPVASAETLGGVKAKAKTDAETVEVAVDEAGKLWVKLSDIKALTSPAELGAITSIFAGAGDDGDVCGLGGAPIVTDKDGYAYIGIIGKTYLGTSTAGAVKPNGKKTEEDTIPVHHDDEGKLWVKPSGGGESGGGTSGVSLYIEDVGNNPALGNVNFGKYKAGDVVLVVQDMAVTKEV